MLVKSGLVKLGLKTHTGGGGEGGRVMGEVNITTLK